ncbi:MAG: transcriptional regulator NrdR [Patescibacteria group bacterium]|jgi:transcriptional repressor NrdR
MHCPVCNHGESKVIDSRLSTDGVSIRRRRACEACDHRFSTVEEIELLDITVTKRDGRREMYSREKLSSGVRRALEKRSYTQEAFRGLLHNIEMDIAKLGTSEVMSSKIGELVMERLRGFDKIAYIRFASVYRAFEDAKTFQNVLDELRAKKSKRKKRK